VYPNVLDWVKRVLKPEYVNRADVLEVGAYDVNGSVRPYIESCRPRKYLGVDAQPGPSVDRVVDCENLRSEVAGQWDVVVSTEMLEHVRNWQICMEQMVEVTEPGGLLLITTCSPGFPFHPFPEDHWRFSVDEMTSILEAIALEVLVVDDDSHNLGVFTLSRKPMDWNYPLARPAWDQLAIPEGRFDA
jgi:SAM-dependent methyltransferase